MSGNIYESNPYLNPSTPYSGDIYGGSGQEGKGGDFEDEPPLLEGKILWAIGKWNKNLSLFTS